AQHVILCLLWQLLKGGAAGDVFVPRWHGFINRLRVVELRLGQRHFVEALTIDVVGHADGDFANAGEHVELGEEVIGKTVDARCVACNHRVVPATTTGTASVDADLATGGLEVFAPLIKKFGWEWAGANAGGVRLDDAQGVGNTSRTNAGAYRCTTGGWVGRGHKRVGAVVDVEHGGLAAFHEHVFAG